MWIKHSNQAVGIIRVPDSDQDTIARLLQDGGQEVDGPDADVPTLSQKEQEAHQEMVQEQIQAVATRIEHNNKKARPTHKR